MAVIHELASDLRLWARYSGFVRSPYLVILPLTHWPQGSTDHPIVHTFKRLPRKHRIARFLPAFTTMRCVLSYDSDVSFA